MELMFNLVICCTRYGVNCNIILTANCFCTSPRTSNWGGVREDGRVNKNDVGHGDEGGCAAQRSIHTKAKTHRFNFVYLHIMQSLLIPVTSLSIYSLLIPYLHTPTLGSLYLPPKEIAATTQSPVSEARYAVDTHHRLEFFRPL